MSKYVDPLRLTALEVADMDAVSAALQDAVAQLGDFDFSKRTRSFTMAFNRYCWEGDKRSLRVRCGVQIGNVLSARSSHLRQGADEAVVNLLSVSYETNDAPSGEMVFIFSGGGELRLSTECLDLVLVDISEPWPATRKPKHKLPKNYITHHIHRHTHTHVQ